MPDKDKKDVKLPKRNNSSSDVQLLKDKSELPKGAVYAGKDENGNDTWEIRTKHEEAVKKPVSNSSNIRVPKSAYRKPVQSQSPQKASTFGETVERFTIPPPVVTPPSNTNTYGEVATYRQLEPPLSVNQDYNTYKFADPSGNYTNNAIRENFQNGKHFTFDKNFNKVFTGKTLDDFTNQSVQQIESPEMSGVNKVNTTDNNTFSQKGTNFTRNSTGGLGLAKSTLGTDVKGSTDTYVPKQYDSLGNEIKTDSGLQPAGSSQGGKEVGKLYEIKDGKPVLTFKKGGLVSKIKGYAVGGDVGYNEFNNLNGLVGQNDPYTDQREIDQKKKNKSKAEEDARNAGNAVGKGLGAYGTAHYSTQSPETNGDAVRQAGLSSVSSIGPIGGAIGGLAALGDQIGKPIKTKSERLDANGNIIDSGKARSNAIGGGLLSPSKALAARSSYKGGWTDITGNKYLASIEDKAKEQLKSVNDANKQSKIQQALDARDANDFEYKPQNIYDTNGSYFNDNKELVLADGTIYDPNNIRTYKSGGLVSKAKQMCKDGGVIKGKGTSKSDSINAKVKPGSFIVPAENAKAAEIIRKEVLAKPPRPKANLNQKGGEEVKLSNGEHMFTKEEKEKLIKKGINVNGLAPEAEYKEEMNEPNSKHNANEEQKEYFQFPKIFGYKDGGPVKGATIDGATWDGKNWIDSKGNKYTAESGQKFTDRYNSSLAKNAQDASVKRSNELSLYKRKYNEAKNSGNEKEANALLKKINELSSSESSDASTKNKSISNTTSLLKVPKSAKTTETFEPISSRNVAASELKKANEMQSDKTVENRDTDLNVASINQDEYKAPSYTKKERKGLASALSNIDPTALVGPAQLALGAKMLRDTKRPVYKPEINRDFNKSVDQAIQQSNYGFSPEERLLNEQNIQNSVNDAKYSGLNLSGANGTQAFNQQRAAINSGLAARIESQVADQRLRREKQQYANQLIANRAGMAQQNAKDVFNIANDTFNQRQQSGAELVGTGLANSIGAYRFRKNLEANNAADLQRTDWERRFAQTA